jgi:hypothetical protein
MAVSRKGPKAKLEEDAIVSALRPDPTAEAPGTVALQGYLGRGAAEGTWRLYLSTELDEFVELPEEAIRHSEKLPDEQGTRVWVDRSTSLQLKRVTSQTVEAEFLAGPITRGPLTQAVTQVAGGAAAALRPYPSLLWQCWPTLSRCPSQLIVCFPSATFRCPSRIDACPSEWIECFPSVGGCPSGLRCPSGVVCPSAVDACPSALGCDSLVCGPLGGTIVERIR